MDKNLREFENYFHYLQAISLRGRIYKKCFSSPILYLNARCFGTRILEVGSGIGSGVLGAFPSQAVGIDINPFAVEFSRNIGLRASLIGEDGVFPIPDETFDVCILDNVLEHIDNPFKVLDECYRVTQRGGGLVIAVPGSLGFKRDSTHRVLYEEDKLSKLDSRWSLIRLFSIPFLFKSKILSEKVKQYCLIAVYKKR